MAEPSPLMAVEVVVAWPRRHQSRRLSLPAGTTAGAAIAASGFDASVLASVTAMAVHGERIQPSTELRDGDRLELLRPLQADPKDARRLRAARQRLRRD